VQRFQRAFSSGFESASNRLELEVQGGIGQVTVDSNRSIELEFTTEMLEKNWRNV
jgi:hypothetical protein